MCCSHYKTENLHRQGQNVLRDPLKGIITAFYTPSEISAYKDTIYKQADGLGVDGLPQAVSRRKSDDRTKLEVEDILHLIDVLDDRCLFSKMPKFVAHDPSRLPFYNTADLDMGLLSLRVAALEEKLSLLSVSSQHVSTPTVLNSDATSNEVSAEEAEEGHVSWAGVARDLHVGNFQQLLYPNLPKQTHGRPNHVLERDFHQFLPSLGSLTQTLLLLLKIVTCASLHRHST